MAELVLDRIQLFLRDARADGDGRMQARSQKLFVDPAGRIRTGDSVPADDRPGLAEIPQKTFA